MDFSLLSLIVHVYNKYSCAAVVKYVSSIFGNYEYLGRDAENISNKRDSGKGV